ncbi:MULTISPECIES: 2-amino-4-hydroxy-6-hydroxymethyldihydropteridine diphosphokinase [Thermodesulfovibrio]|jgi:2-amino-4-hydroxy-6-hydroxymethyldihydropteridine diphosphokinase|uniref:2-amino-4-hydroxy-6- hydroxymethyldihydropteridine diphosphokinase n=1 Tax=Thermodesulfovibrio TaxID=28261 RepID=UPI00260F9186|nr:2-amino-4-hydroxy-6-hydroxymethyldihydropteridine diphosphokinase [Thermodesulfovibrio sp.]
MNLIYLSLGSNLGDREKNLETALSELKNEGIVILKKSSIYETAPWGYEKQPEFLNMAMEGLTLLEPYDLLKLIKEIENKMGRKKTIKYGPRVIDIDIIFYNNIILKSEVLTIPHPLMHKRDFVLKPLCEIASEFIHPELKISVKKLLDNL